MSVSAPATAPTGIDPRGPRFAAAITSVVLMASLLAGLPWGLLLLGLQAVVFVAGSLLGPSAQPYGILFRRVVRPRLGPPGELEDERPPRFAQTVGLVFAVAGLIGGLLGSALIFYVALGFALVAGLLNAVFNVCLGCELYLIGRRLRSRAA